MVAIYYQKNQFGYLRRHVERLTREMAKKYTDYNITVPQLLNKKAKFKQETYIEVQWMLNEKNLFNYLTNSEKEGMRASDKVSYDGIECYPFEEEDKRSRKERK
jgi:hypothetical protein